VGHVATIRTLEARLEAIAEQVIRLEQRAATGTRLDQAIWTIWQHCRNTKDSLDSERQCKAIRSVIDSAVVEVEKRCEDLAVKLAKAESQNTEYQKLLKKKSKEKEEVQG